MDSDTAVAAGFFVDCQQKHYTILKEDIRQFLEEDDESLCGSSHIKICCIFSGMMCMRHGLLMKRDSARLLAYFEKPAYVQSRAREQLITCGIYAESFPLDEVTTDACSHLLCASCCTTYVNTEICEGSICLRLRCPIPSLVLLLGTQVSGKPDR
ncbi:hypothetical protein RJ639_027378 [Escallonia herrerae]|uniref:Uncharacterized protein n=1 Tax=Escallonia herrerae TaxID=1293975 RepID=A0AA89BP55_9ASTE|nr:hypothetical protein RJ639_027378 [Escallonia herrerae]